jgi:UDP-N-acetylglucosamine 2-epimerase
VIDTGYDTREIVSAIDRALHDEAFKRKVKTAKNPYGDGTSSKKIVGILEKIEINPDLLQKRMMY